jgi:hypothetical protein
MHCLSGWMNRSEPVSSPIQPFHEWGGTPQSIFCCSKSALIAILTQPSNRYTQKVERCFVWLHENVYVDDKIRFQFRYWTGCPSCRTHYWQLFVQWSLLGTMSYFMNKGVWKSDWFTIQMAVFRGVIICPILWKLGSNFQVGLCGMNSGPACPFHVLTTSLNTTRKAAWASAQNIWGLHIHPCHYFKEKSQWRKR